jgi:1-acyl-sn-glycerol-3-phosphate acyltransferase
MDIVKSVMVWLIGICFITILFPVTFIIWLLVLPFDRNRVIVHWLLVYQGILLTWVVPLWKIRIEGLEKVDRGTTYVIISNHQSMLDIIMLNRIRCKFKWISKVENVRVPVLGWYLRMADYITVNRGDEGSKAIMLERSLTCLKRGISIMIFPEGTRSADREIGFFKRGAFQLAIQAGVPVLAVLIDGTGDILPKHGLMFRSGHLITIRILNPVYPGSFGTSIPEELAFRFNSSFKEELSSLRNKE